MKLHQVIFAAAVTLFFTTGTLTATAQSTNTVTSTPVYVPDYSHANQPMPNGIIAWDSEMKTVDATDGQEFARFTFSFTNVTTNIVAILNVHPSCGCTTAEIPAQPWILTPGTNATMRIKVDLEGKFGTLFKFVDVTTDKGKTQLNLRINIKPAPPMKISAAQRAAGVAAAKVDRQAVFKGNCASCHIKNVQSKYGERLFQATCSICHGAKPRATMVPDLANLKVPTSEEFWRTWITYGKPGTLMPAFAQSQGGPLTDMQIASLSAYLNAIHPSHVPPTKK